MLAKKSVDAWLPLLPTRRVGISRQSLWRYDFAFWNKGLDGKSPPVSLRCVVDLKSLIPKLLLLQLRLIILSISARQYSVWASSMS